MAKSASKKVLIVEDDELNMKLFCDLLASHGYDAIKSVDGMRAVEMAKEVQPDLVIMDIQLPQVSGLDLARWIKDDDATRAVPIMAVTAFAMRQDEEEVKEAGCEAYMTKPIQIVPFIEMVEKLTSMRGEAH
jgi:two-component system cell cycle response regulator DivK